MSAQPVPAEVIDAAFDVAVRARDTAYGNDPWAWLTEQVITRDEATQAQTPWPKDKQYLRELLSALDREQMLAIPKSRRMMVTWLVAAWVTWRVRYRPNNEVYWQSATETVAAEAVNGRCAFIEDNLRTPFLRRKYAGLRTQGGLIGRMRYDQTGSGITAIAEGGDKIRSRTPSILVMDECEFQPEAPMALTAAMATVEKSAKLVLISSSNGPRGVLAEICREVGLPRFA